jgi:hypothetical protein
MIIVVYYGDYTYNGEYDGDYCDDYVDYDMIILIMI